MKSKERCSRHSMGKAGEVLDRIVDSRTTIYAVFVLVGAAVAISSLLALAVAQSAQDVMICVGISIGGISMGVMGLIGVAYWNSKLTEAGLWD